MKDMNELVSAIEKAAPAPAFRRRMGKVISIQSNYTITVTIAGSDVQIDGVRYFAHYAPTVGSHVWLDTDGVDWIAAGAVAGLGGDIPTCKVYRTADLNIATGTTYTTVTWQAESYDTASMWTSGTDVIVPLSGIYLVHATASWNGNATGYRTCLIKRGTTTIGYTQDTATSTNVMQQQAIASCTANAGDAIILQVRQGSGGTLALSGTQVYETQMVVTYLGPDQ